jgi:hypothetical protein
MYGAWNSLQLRTPSIKKWIDATPLSEVLTVHATCPEIVEPSEGVWVTPEGAAGGGGGGGGVVSGQGVVATLTAAFGERLPTAS